MTQKIPALTESELDRCLRLFGPPPVLSTENAEHFNALLDGIIKSLKLRDLLELTLVRQAVCAQWLINRYMRHGTIAIERRYQETCKYQALRTKLRQQAAQRKEQTQAQNSVQNPPDVARLANLGANVQNLVEDGDAIFERTASERDHNKALEQTIAFQERLNTLMIGQTAIRNETFRQLELYRQGLGRQAQETTDAILDAHYRVLDESTAPALLPADPAGSDDTEAQARQ